MNLIKNANVKKFLETLPDMHSKPLINCVNYANKDALDLLQNFLEMNPLKRITASQALAHPYLKEFYEPDDEPIFKDEIDFKFENDCHLKLGDIEKMIFEVINSLRSFNKQTPIDIQSSKFYAPH